ncbi:glycosyltransferase family 39 protein [Nocardia sp. NPDC051570]|uniref:glycosyltransferase family 39 protein n=1 Tax=Nocardia sp. NPDC051570 TaxID=3364324 RepID=UPI00378E7BB1
MTDVMADLRQVDSNGARPRFAVAGVATVVVLAAVALSGSIGHYGFYGDELYFIAAGRRFSFGYADQGPLVPAISWLMDVVAPGSFVAQRIPVVVLTLAAIVLCALIAREFGGSGRAQILAAIAYASSPFLLVQATVLSTNAIDTALWVLLTWMLVRWVRTRDNGLLLWAGLVTAVDMQVKWIVPVLWVAVAICVLVFGPRELVRRWQLWCGALATVAVTVPTVLWQNSHGWPQVRFTAVVAAEQDALGGRVVWVPLALGAAGLLGAVLLIVGVVVLMRWEPLRPYRFLGFTLLVVAAVFVISDGRPYYAAGLYGAVMAAGAVWWTRVAARWRTIATAVLVVSSLALQVFSSLPIRSAADLEPAESPTQAWAGITVYGQFGWPELRDATAAAYRALPEEERSRAVVIADTFWQASALDVDRDRYGLPAIYSPSRGFGYFGTPPDSASTVLWVGGDEPELRRQCGSLVQVGRVDVLLGLPRETRDVTVWRCDRPTEPWSSVWPRIRHLN